MRAHGKKGSGNVRDRSNRTGKTIAWAALVLVTEIYSPAKPDTSNAAKDTTAADTAAVKK